MRATVLILSGLALTTIFFTPVLAQKNGEPVDVGVGLYVISFGNYDVNKGTYTIDSYIWFRWDPAKAPSNFTPLAFEFMNGRASSKEKISDDILESGQREVWYRVQANLYNEPVFRDYPFDRQDVALLIEDTVHSTDELVYHPLTGPESVDKDFRISGWKIENVATSNGTKAYPFGEDYSRYSFDVTIVREPTSTAIKTVLPPLVFMAVSGLSFFFGADKIANRVGLSTAMLISAVMFHISQTSSLPPLGSLILMDKIMIATYTFLAGSLVVTTVLQINQDVWKRPDMNSKINRLGGAATIVAPIVTAALLLGL
ncbi:MAG: hypothetical protein HY556_00950 [Euryarchaeota archaeon]|nr:hypothetical protein [Euryarchaeota archaeon]